MVKNVKIVIGASYGDEGKGLMTDYFSHQSITKDEKCIVVLCNGGAQRGHTVTLPNGTRHVFHHFGSGTFAGADTYLNQDFILNPIVFREEWSELESIGYKPRVFIDCICLLTTPYDMIINQLLEEKRSKQRHGSCGMGIYETIHREEKNHSTLFTLISNKDREDRVSYIKHMRDTYFRNRLEELDIRLDSEWESIFSSEQMIQNYIDDFIFMMDHVSLFDDFSFEKYNAVIFENGQGLLLDQNNTEYFPHLTPSNTGIKNPCKGILRSRGLKKTDIEVCYVTRPYLTRHGAGRLDGECDKSDIFPGLEDQTNVPNQFQGTLRYAKLDVPELITRIQKDFEYMKNFNAKLSLAVTHTNEAPDSFCYEDISKPFDCIYCSDGVDRNTVSVK